MTAAVIILAGGSGIRVGSDIPKQYLSIGGRSILRRTVEAFTGHPEISRVQVVFRPEDQELYDAAVAGLDLPAPVPGGATRQESGRAGLEAIADDPPELVLIHDAARPFVDHGVIDRTLAVLKQHPAALPAMPVTDTVKRGAGTADDPLVGETIPRDGLWRAQTPQGFRYADILSAHRTHAGDGLTDDAAVAEAAGMTIALVEGSEDNVKITTTEDLERARRHVGADIRTGSGFDVHAFDDGDHVTLCGIDIPHDRGLAGHSDADAGLHALTDAILGTIGAGDIGQHFPPSDPQWKGAPSDMFLRHAAGLVADRGGSITSVDVTLICERPKIGPHRDAMVARVADILSLDTDRVSIKATTTEGLGFTGRREGIAAQAVATVSLS